METLRQNAVLFALCMLLLVSLCMLLIAPLYRDKKKKRTHTAPLLTGVLLSPSEQIFFDALQQALAGRTWIFPKVRSEAIVGSVPESMPRHIDFLLCEPGTFRNLAAIQLDNDARGSVEDAKSLDEVFSQAGFPLIHFPARTSYATAGFQAEVETLLSPYL